MQVSDAIAHLQKNYSQRVTGTLTIPVRRVLHLPWVLRRRSAAL